jgi:GWxTD domain-containing protein
MPFRRLAVIALIVLAATTCFAGVSKKDIQALPEHYRNWLTREVNYIISENEKEVFVHLGTDADRDKFIDRFWAIRNPDPDSPSNRYKDEIYERIAYANQYFGHTNGTLGELSDMGRVYITLGPPKQRQKLLNFANIRPMEIWFYDNSNGALPPYFYVVFYQRDLGDDFRLYSPYMDGPPKLVTSYQAESGRMAAWQVIQHDAGDETAHIVLSLLPDEPVDTDTATSSLTSDVMLNTIKTLKDNPWTTDMLEQRRRLLEDVTHRVILNDEFLNVITIPLRDERGNTSLHYLLRLKKAEDFAIARNSAGKYYSAAEVTVRVSTADKKLIFTQQRELSRFLDDDEFAKVKDKLFGYEGVLPLPPGKYNIEFLLANKLKKTAFRAEKDIVVPEAPASGIRLSDIIPFEQAEGAPAGAGLPFQIANVKFTPGIGQDLTLIQGQPLQFMYQIWSPAADPATYGDAKLQAEVSYGRMGLHDTKTISDELEKKQFSAAGAMVNGKKIDTSDLGVGNYRLSVTVSDPVTHEKAFSSLAFRVVNSEGTPAAWDMVDPESADASRKGEYDFERAQCYLSAGNALAGAAWLQRAFQKNPEDEDVRTRLVDSFFSKQDFKQIAAVYTRAAITSKTDDQTILHIAESFDKLGQTSKSVEILEAAVSMKPQSGPLFLSLADYYQRLGNTQKANEMQQKGRSLVREGAQTGS